MGLLHLASAEAPDRLRVRCILPEDVPRSEHFIEMVRSSERPPHLLGDRAIADHRVVMRPMFFSLQEFQIDETEAISVEVGKRGGVWRRGNHNRHLRSEIVPRWEKCASVKHRNLTRADATASALTEEGVERADTTSDFFQELADGIYLHLGANLTSHTNAGL